MSAPGAIYGLCPRCVRFCWHNPIGMGWLRCAKCGASHRFGEARKIAPPKPRRNKAGSGDEIAGQKGLFE